MNCRISRNPFKQVNYSNTFGSDKSEDLELSQSLQAGQLFQYFLFTDIPYNVSVSRNPFKQVNYSNMVLLLYGVMEIRSQSLQAGQLFQYFPSPLVLNNR